MRISQREAADVFGVPEVVLYVCDGKRECGKPRCLDHSLTGVCHHTRDESHALYAEHDMSSFERRPSVSGDVAAVICVEPVRG